MNIAIFYIPVKDQEEASRLGQLAIEQRLAACANVFPIHSLYPWDGQLQQDHEHVLLLKSVPSKSDELQSFIQQHHSYEIPCILHWEAGVNERYGNWMLDQIR